AGVGEGEDDLTDECGAGAGELADEAMLTNKEMNRRTENLVTAIERMNLNFESKLDLEIEMAVTVTVTNE
ncbi:hypothetical protein A2U01_0104613, partial [Trifolium medium]|nr:hypothetical protein [Trifolium medium]